MTKKQIMIADSIFNAEIKLDYTKALVDALYIITEGPSGSEFDSQNMNHVLAVILNQIDKVAEELDIASRLFKQINDTDDENE